MGLRGLLCLILVGSSGFAQSTEQQLTALLEKSRQGPPQRWAELLIQADALAEKLARRDATPGARLVSLQGYTLTYRLNGVSPDEDYQHDLLKLVAHTQEGTKWGADALVALFFNPNYPTELAYNDEWLHPYQVVIDLLESPRWRALHDPRLDLLLGEAYETWWSLSKSNADDPNIADRGLSPADFAKGAVAARTSAIAAYERALRAQPADSDLQKRVASLRAGKDTKQRRWFPPLD